MIDLNDVCSLTEFRRNMKRHVLRLQETGRAQVLTVNGRAALVVQSAAAYQQLLDQVAGRPREDCPAASASHVSMDAEALRGES